MSGLCVFRVIFSLTTNESYTCFSETIFFDTVNSAVHLRPNFTFSAQFSERSIDIVRREMVIN